MIYDKGLQWEYLFLFAWFVKSFKFHYLHSILKIHHRYKHDQLLMIRRQLCLNSWCLWMQLMFSLNWWRLKSDFSLEFCAKVLNHHYSLEEIWSLKCLIYLMFLCSRLLNYFIFLSASKCSNIQCLNFFHSKSFTLRLECSAFLDLSFSENEFCLSDIIHQCCTQADKPLLSFM